MTSKDVEAQCTVEGSEKRLSGAESGVGRTSVRRETLGVMDDPRRAVDSTDGCMRVYFSFFPVSAC